MFSVHNVYSKGEEAGERMEGERGERSDADRGKGRGKGRREVKDEEEEKEKER